MMWTAAQEMFTLGQEIIRVRIHLMRVKMEVGKSRSIPEAETSGSNFQVQNKVGKEKGNGKKVI